MGTTEETERRVITELTHLLRKNADKLLSGETKLCLTTSSLGTISSNFRRVSDLSEEDERREIEGHGLITGSVNGRLKKKVEDIRLWRDNIRTLQDFVVKTKALKIIHGTYTIRAPVQIARFQSLQVLEVKKVPIHMVEGLSKLRGQLKEIIVTRSLQKLQDLFEICGGDRSSGLTWQSLKKANIGFNGLDKLDGSLKYVPFLEVFDVSHNNLKDTENCLQDLTDLQRINLGYNELTKVPSFSYSIKGILKTLVLRNNNLDNLEGIEDLSSLEELDVAHNLLVDHQCFVVLSKLKKLNILCLTGNPLSYKLDHRMKTIEYLCLAVGSGIFLLDGQRLTVQEISYLRTHQKKVISRETSSSIIVRDMESSGDSASIHNTEPPSDSVDPSRLSVKKTGNADSTDGSPIRTSVKKKGHRRMPSKERVAVIADIMDGTDTETVDEKTQSQSYVEDPQLLERIESEKRKYEIMRKHYKDDWLKVLQANQGTLPDKKSVKRSKQGEVTAEEKENEGRDTVTVEPKIEPKTSKVEDKVKKDADKDPKKEAEISAGPSPSDDKVDSVRKESTENDTSTSTVKINTTTDIYSLRRVAPPDRMQEDSVLFSPDTPEQPKGIEWGRSDSQQKIVYGEESAPFIVRLPDDGMKQMFITVNDRYITEKNLNGQKCEMLDLKCLQSKKRSEEILTGQDIIGTVLMPLVTLEFDYVKKDMRQRKYAMEDDTFAQEFEELIDQHLRAKELQSQMKELVQCFRCEHKFFKPTKSSSPGKCPKCKSTVVIELNIRQFEHKSTKECTASDPPAKKEKKKKKQIIPSQKSPSFIRKKAIRKDSPSSKKHEPTQQQRAEYGSLPRDIVPQMREKKISDGVAGRHRSFRNVTYYEEQDTFQESTSASRSSTSLTHSQIKHNHSCPDVRTSGSHSVPRGSVSSIESDIAVLVKHSSQSSVSAISESSQEVTVTGSRSPISKELVSKTVRGENGADWITPVGSPLSNSVCSSMVSSVYENTLATEVENADGVDVPDGFVNKVDNLTGSSTEPVRVKQKEENQSGSFSNQKPSIQNSDNPFESVQNTVIDSEVKIVLTGEESASIYVTADSSISVNKSYNGGHNIPNSVGNLKGNSSVPSIYDSVTTETEPRTSSPDDQSSLDTSLLRRPSKTRRNLRDDKRSGHYGAESFESSLEVSDNKKISGSYSEDKVEFGAEVTVDHVSNKDQGLHPELEFPSDLSPIKRTSRHRLVKQSHRSAIILGDTESLSNDSSRSASLDVSQLMATHSESELSSSGQVCHSPPAVSLPWEQKESSQGERTDGSKHESLIHDEFVNVDHRLQLYLELKIFSSTETCQCVLQCDIVQYLKPDAIRSLLVISTTRLLLFEIIGDLDSESDSDWLKCYEDQPITELRYVDVGLGYQSLRLEFGTDCSSYTLLIMDEGRCKKFLTLITGIIQTVSLNELSKLQGITKSNPTTHENLEKQVLNRRGDPQKMVQYLLIQLLDNEDPKKRDTKGLVITETDVILVQVNHQWPLPRLQAPLNADVKGQQFTVLREEHINNIESLEFNEYNPKELRLSFFNEGSEEKVIWVIAMETTQGVKSLVDAIREPWENAFGVSLDVTPVSFSEGEQT